MKTFLLLSILGLSSLCLGEPAPPAASKKEAAKTPPAAPKKGGTTVDVRAFLIGTKWSWRNVSAGVPDRECIFMDDGTFRHPHFVAKFTVKDPHVVVLTKKGGKAVLTFDTDFKTFEAIDFNNVRITGSRL
ncbi:hypothetical protein [Prosthecobacter sp.]|uniref:hypothetical protein n=1 Tax=Prosthecobacter sp. TaxID=1965333 RepID=UPI002ABC6021|nr:hypothetical protein [Prosthecobacter sp.]MDZ4405681.1 hypothetical protein [Prosthecobacter sp.]